MRRIYRCVAGDTFDLAALVIWGEEMYAHRLMEANPGLCGVHVFSGGEELTIPEIELPGADRAEGYTRTTAPWKE